MKNKFLRYCNAILLIGHQEGMDIQVKVRLMTLNALMVISIGITILFVAVNALMGAYAVFQSLFLIPILSLVLYANHIGKYNFAGILLSYLLLVVVLLLAITERRTGTEYVLIAIGCCSVLIFEQTWAVLISFIAAFCCYAFYKWYDAHHVFIENPSIPYAFAQNSLMLISGFVVVIQSLVFRSLVRHYASSLKEANQEIAAMNEELRASNEELQAFSENLDLMVRQQSAELHAYIGAIDVSIYSTVSNLDGKFIKVNRQVTSMSGYSLDELIGQHYSILGSGNHPDQFFDDRRKVLIEGKVWRGDVEHKTKNGSLLWFDCVVMPIRGTDGLISNFLTIGLPITEKKTQEKVREGTLKLLETITFSTSHQIRGPLARVKGLSDLIKKGMVDHNELTLIAGKMMFSCEELDAATSELVNYVNTHQDSFYEGS